MGARKLYIADVLTSIVEAERESHLGESSNGKQVPDLYAFDLDRQPESERQSFQVWGGRDGWTGEKAGDEPRHSVHG